MYKEKVSNPRRLIASVCLEEWYSILAIGFSIYSSRRSIYTVIYKKVPYCISYQSINVPCGLIFNLEIEQFRGSLETVEVLEPESPDFKGADQSSSLQTPLNTPVDRYLSTLLEAITCMSRCLFQLCPHDTNCASLYHPRAPQYYRM